MHAHSVRAAHLPDDVETECTIALALDTAKAEEWHAAVAVPMPTHSAPTSWAQLAERVDPEDLVQFQHTLDRVDGVAVAELDARMRAVAAHAVAVACPVMVVGYAAPRLTLTKHEAYWTLPSEHGRFVACAWRSVHGTPRPDVWRQRLALVASWIAARPGIAFRQLLAQLAPAVDRAELGLLLRAMEHAGVLRVRATDVWPLTDTAALEGTRAPWFALV